MYENTKIIATMSPPMKILEFKNNE